VRSVGVVVDPPFFDDPLRLSEVGEEVLIKALVAQSTVEALDEAMKDKARAMAAVINVLFNFRLLAAGMKDLGSATKSIGAYQAGSVVVMRGWAKANSDTLVRYLRAIIEGRRWLLNPANKAEAIRLLVDRIKLSPEIAARAYAVVTDPTEGFNKDAQFDMEGFKNVLKLRAEIEGQWDGKPPAPERYFDLFYYNKAIAGLLPFSLCAPGAGVAAPADRPKGGRGLQRVHAAP
jgi:hypothetical protein